MTGYEKELTDAIDALEYRLKNREPGTDDRAFAAEFMQALIGQGWRPTEARKTSWRPAKQGAGVQPGDDYRAALAEVRDKAARDARLLGHHREGAA